MAVEAEIVVGGKVHDRMATDDAARAGAGVMTAIKGKADPHRIGQRPLVFRCW